MNPIRSYRIRLQESCVPGPVCLIYHPLILSWSAVLFAACSPLLSSIQACTTTFNRIYILWIRSLTKTGITFRTRISTATYLAPSPGVNQLSRNWTAWWFGEQFELQVTWRLFSLYHADNVGNMLLGSTTESNWPCMKITKQQVKAFKCRWVSPEFHKQHAVSPLGSVGVTAHLAAMQHRT